MNNVTSINLTNDNNGNSATANATAYSGYTTSYTPAVAATANATAYSGYTTSYVPAHSGSPITMTTASSSTSNSSGTSYYVQLTGYGKKSSDNTGDFTSLAGQYAGTASTDSSNAGVASSGYVFTSSAAANAFGAAIQAKVNADKSSTTPTSGNYWCSPRTASVYTFYYISSYYVYSISSTRYGTFYSATSYSFSTGSSTTVAASVSGTLGSSTTVAGGGTYYLATYYASSSATSRTTSSTYKFTTTSAATSYGNYLSYQNGKTTASGSYGTYTNGSAAVAAKLTGSLGSSTTVAGGGTYYTANYYASSSATTTTSNTSYKFTSSSAALQYAYYLSYNAGCTTARGTTTSRTNGNAANTYFSTFQHDRNKMKNGFEKPYLCFT